MLIGNKSENVADTRSGTKPSSETVRMSLGGTATTTFTIYNLNYVTDLHKSPGSNLRLLDAVWAGWFGVVRD